MENKNEMQDPSYSLFPFDPIVVVRDVLKRWLLIVLAVLVVGVGSYIYTDLSYEPVYRSQITFVVTSRGASSTVYSNLSSTSSLATVFKDLLNSSLLRKEILNETGLPSFNGSISAAVVPETNLITVTVSASEPRTAFAVARAIIEHHEDVTYQVVDGVSLEVLQKPTVPVAPINSTNAFYAMKRTGVMAGAATAVLLAALSFGQNTIRSEREFRQKLECPFLGEIPHEKKRRSLLQRLRRTKNGILITNPVTSFSFLENIRKLRRRIEQKLHGRKVVMVTSLLENEGKSTVAVNLALSMAQKHERVLLIECDLRKPAGYRLLNQRELTHGVRDVLSGKCDPEEAILCDKMSGLFMLLENRGGRDSSDLVSTETMHELIRWARKNYDYVVLDLPPMVEASDAESVMEFADASVLVVRQNTAATPAISKAIAILDGGRAKLLGCVLNNVYSSPITAGSYGYGYGTYGHHGKYGRYGQYGHYGNYNKRSEESGQ